MNREELKKIKDKILENEKNQEKLAKESGVLWSLCNKISEQIVKEEKLLSEGVWTLKINDSGSISLFAKDKYFKEFINICGNGWGIRFDGGDMDFHEHDGDMYINIKDDEELERLMKDYGLKIDIKEVLNKKEKFKTAIKVIEKVVNRLEMKNETMACES